MAAVKLELEGLAAAAAERPTLAACALAVARTLDDHNFGSSHASLSKELRNVMTDLHAVVAPHGRLAAVRDMANRRGGADKGA